MTECGGRFQQHSLRELNLVHKDYSIKPISEANYKFPIHLHNTNARKFILILVNHYYSSTTLTYLFSPLKSSMNVLSACVLCNICINVLL